MLKFQLFALLFTLTSLAACQISAQNFKFKEGKYSIDFPGTPKEERQTVPIEGMGEIEMVAMMYEPSLNKVFMVAHADYPDAIVKAAKKSDKDAVSSIVHNAKDGAVGQMQLTISEEKVITLQGNKGISFMGDNGQIYTKYQIFLVGNRLYQVAILSQDSPISKAEANKFLNSFKLIK